MAKKVTVSLSNAANNVLYVGCSSGTKKINLKLTAVDINPNSGYYYKYYVYINGKEFGYTDYIAIDYTIKNIEVSGETATTTPNAEYFPSNSTTSNAYCEVITYKGTGSSASEVSREKVTFVAKLHEDVKPTVGDIHFNPQDIPLDNYSNTLLNDYNRFGIYIGYNSSSNLGTLWQPTPGSSIVSYTISGPGIETKIVSTSNGSYKYSVDKVRVTGAIDNTGKQLSYTVTVKDSRGRTNSKTATYDKLYPYTFPRINVLEIFRSDVGHRPDDNNGKYIYIDFSVQYSTIGGKNSCTYKITKDGTTLTTGSITNSLSKFHTLSLDDTAAHQIAIVATDGLGNSTTYLYNLPSIERIINIKSDGKGIAFGKKAEQNLQIQSSWTFVGPVSNTSDEKVKTNISGISVDILNTLKPVQYNFTHTEDDQTHYGFIAQDVIESLKSEGVDANRIGLIGQTIHHGEQLYTLAYIEFIPLIVKKCQELQQENNEMRAEIAEIKQLLLQASSE